MKIIAHRGASFYAPENTMSAFRMAMELGVDGIEMDVHLTKDNEIVVIHDLYTGRTGTRNYKVSNSRFTTLKKMDFGGWFDSKFKGEKILRMNDVVERTEGWFDLYIEIKSGIEIIDKFCESIERFKDIKNKMTIMSFNYDVVLALKKMFNDLKVLWIIEYGYNVAIEKSMYTNVFRKIEFASLDGVATHAELTHCLKMAKGIKANRLFWNVWTVDNPHLAKQLKKLNVDSLTTNRPDWIMKNLF